jgi:F-type H+-transporting ATPase subunit a
MPHGESWFTLAFRGTFLWENIVSFVTVVNRMVTGGPGSILADETGHVGHVFGAFFILVVLGVLAFLANAKVKDTAAAIVPEDRMSIRTFFELFVGAAYSMMADIMGPKPARFFLPLIGTCAFFILFSNGLGLVPGFTPPTDNLNTTLALAAVIFFATHIYGIKENGANHVKHLFGPILKWYALPLMLLMFFIEVISHIARPISLSIRLMANMVADHLVVGAFLTVFAFVVPVPVMVLGTLVVIVQTLVFCVLSTVYIGLAVQHDEGHH